MQSHHEAMKNQKQGKPHREDKKRNKKDYNRKALRNQKRDYS